MALLSLQDISLRLGGPPLLENCRLNIERGQKICLLGRNGTGKTSLMRVITGAMEPDSGTILKEKDMKISWFTQDIPDHLDGTAFDVIAQSLGTRGELLISYFNGDEQNHLELHSRMEEEQAWDALGEIQKTCSLFDIDPHWQYDKLSGGQKRRILLAAALAGEPDLLLLDEPTNHLDVQTILWLEELLLKPGLTLLLVTHDRAFMKRLANRIIELDRGRIFDWDCGYEIFLERKQALLEAQEKQWENFDKKLAQEEQWIRKGIRARRTRNEGRVRALLQMREDKKQRILQQGNAVIQVDQNTHSGKLVLRADDLSFSYGDNPIIKDLTLEITRGEKIGIIGPNGCGKTTLVKLLLKELTADSGRIKMGSRLEITYFDQMRQQLDPEKSVWKNVLPNGDTVTINGRNKNIIAYLQDFLFTPERAKTPVAHLSGGERNRLLLARLFTQPTNFMILDEPTNDLDAETLELLEELLVNFDGTLLLISHDRTFINNVVTSSLVFEGEGQVTEYIGGYDDWQNLKKQVRNQPSEEEKAKGRQQYEEQKKAQKQQRARKLSFKEKRELEQLPALIEQKENEQEQLHSTMADPDFLREGEKVKEATERLDQLEKELEQAYARWEELENIGD